MEARQLASVNGSAEPLVATPPAPENVLVSASDGALEVDAPRVRLGVEVQRPERDPDFSRPAVRAYGGSGLPDAVPRLAAAAEATEATVAASAAATTAHEAIAHEPRWVDLEEIAGTPVLERIEDPLEAVVGVQKGVALALEGEDAVRIVIDDRPDVEVVIIVGDPDLGALGRLAALHRILLREVRDGDRERPELLLDTTVELDFRAVAQPVRLQCEGLVLARLLGSSEGIRTRQREA